MKIDKRKNYYITIDTETTQGWGKGGKFYSPLIYDIGFAIHDKKGRIYETGNYIIKEIFYSRAMKTAFYGNKIPWYTEQIATKKIQATTFAKAIYEINKVCKKYGKLTILAYNANFDISAILKTATYTGLKQFDGTLESVFYMVKKIEVRDVWGLFVETIGVRKSYKKFTDVHGFVSEKGNRQTSAEVAYRYLTQNANFVEDHTALSDVFIEVFIFTQAMRQKKKHSKEILGQPWRLVQD